MSEPSSHRDAARITRSPDDRKGFVFRVRQSAREIAVIGGGFVFDLSDVLVGQRRGDERVFPGEMPRDPVAHDGGELADLQTEPPVLPRGVAHGVFIEADLHTVIGRVEARVDP